MEQDITTQRLEAAFSSAGISQAELSRRSGIDRGSISLYLSGRYCPKADKLLRLAEALNVSPQWLSGAADDPHPDPDALLPVFCGVDAGGTLVDTGDTFAVPHRWLTEEEGRFFLLRVTGLAMYPRLLEGDLLLVDSAAPWKDNAIAVLVQDSALLIRQVQGNQLFPANPEFPPRPVSGDQRRLGCAVQLIRRL